MNAHRIKTTVTADRTLVLDDLPFQAGDAVEVIIRERTSEDERDEAGLTAQWFAASAPFLREVWDNDEDAAYDEL